MKAQSLMSELLDLAERLQIEVRCEFLRGRGAGLCTLHGRKILFVDSDASLADQIDQTAEAIASIGTLDDLYLRPQIRQLIDKYRKQSP
ncbi:MAG: hypothetical protein IID32_03675 [Planctomycetes bacterium]|nr:hypothetical protein [Planctomycetota bacterium]